MPIAFLCPVPAVRARAQASPEASLSDVLAAGTRDVHAASDALIRAKAPLAFSDPALWTQLLSQFFYVYRALEDALDQGASRDARVHALHAPFFSRLARSHAFLADIAFHGGGRPLAPPLPQTAAYVAAVSALATAKPLLLVAYAQTLYLALLAGGQALDKLLRGAMLLPPGRGSALFDFSAALPAEERERFRRALKAAVDALGEGLTSEERTSLLQEKRSIFWRNDAIIAAVLKDARGSLLFAWLRVLRAVFLSLRRYLLALLALLIAVIALLAQHRRVRV